MYSYLDFGISDKYNENLTWDGVLLLNFKFLIWTIFLSESPSRFLPPKKSACGHKKYKSEIQN